MLPRGGTVSMPWLRINQWLMLSVLVFFVFYKILCQHPGFISRGFLGYTITDPSWLSWLSCQNLKKQLVHSLRPSSVGGQKVHQKNNQTRNDSCEKNLGLGLTAEHDMLNVKLTQHLPKRDKLMIFQLVNTTYILSSLLLFYNVW